MLICYLGSNSIPNKKVLELGFINSPNFLHLQKKKLQSMKKRKEKILKELVFQFQCQQEWNWISTKHKKKKSKNKNKLLDLAGSCKIVSYFGKVDLYRHDLQMIAYPCLTDPLIKFFPWNSRIWFQYVTIKELAGK